MKEPRITIENIEVIANGSLNFELQNVSVHFDVTSADPGLKRFFPGRPYVVREPDDLPDSIRPIIEVLIRAAQEHLSVPETQVLGKTVRPARIDIRHIGFEPNNANISISGYFIWPGNERDSIQRVIEVSSLHEDIQSTLNSIVPWANDQARPHIEETLQTVLAEQEFADVSPGKLKPTPPADLPEPRTPIASPAQREAERSSSPMDYEWDVFISHASEDKELFVRELAHRLTSEGLRVWYDDFTLKVGDSLRRSIDDGLARSRFGIVVLSHAFFAKEWPQRELDGLTTRERNGTKVILPVWFDVGRADVEQYSLTLADRVAARADSGLDMVVPSLLDVIRPTNVGADPPVMIEVVGGLQVGRDVRFAMTDPSPTITATVRLRLQGAPVRVRDLLIVDDETGETGYPIGDLVMEVDPNERWSAGFPLESSDAFTEKFIVSSIPGRVRFQVTAAGEKYASDPVEVPLT